MQHLPSRSWSAGSLSLGSSHMAKGAQMEGKRSKAALESELQDSYGIEHMVYMIFDMSYVYQSVTSDYPTCCIQGLRLDSLAFFW